jgi:DNA-binding NarL/FixJ family response regulator
VHIEGERLVNCTKDNPFRLLSSDEPHLSVIPEYMVQPLRLVHKGNSYKVVAEQLNVPIGTVRSRINRARARIIKMRAAAQ